MTSNYLQTQKFVLKKPMTYHEDMIKALFRSMSIKPSLLVFPVPLMLGFEDVPRISLVKKKKIIGTFENKYLEIYNLCFS